jgi:acetyl esterase/lipase
MAFDLDSELVPWTTRVPKLDLNDVATVRETERQVLSEFPPYEPGRQLSVTDISVPGPRNAPDVPVRIYAPTDRGEVLPALLYLHAGGYAFGSLATVHHSARAIADRLDVVVVNVEHRLAPEDPYPAALDDCYAVLEWSAGSTAVEHGIDAERIGVLGESSGGGLATALALLSRERGGPRLTAQFLDAPTVDDRLNTHSMRTIADATTWQSVNSPIAWSYYLAGVGGQGGADVPFLAAPARAEVPELAGLPPAWVAAYEVDPTRDEVLNYARRLTEAGVPTELHLYSGAFHIAHILPGTKIGTRMNADKFEAIRRMLRTEQ